METKTIKSLQSSIKLLIRSTKKKISKFWSWNFKHSFRDSNFKGKNNIEHTNKFLLFLFSSIFSSTNQRLNHKIWNTQKSGVDNTISHKISILFFPFIFWATKHEKMSTYIRRPAIDSSKCFQIIFLSSFERLLNFLKQKLSLPVPFLIFPPTKQRF